MFIDRRFFSQFDWLLLATILFIVTAGLIVLYSAGYNPDGRDIASGWLPFAIQSPTFARQFVFIGVGAVFLIAGLSLSPQILHRYAYVFYAGCLILLALVLIVGSISQGSRRWLSLGIVNLQPAELAKIAVLLALARYLAKRPPAKSSYGILELFVPFCILCVPMGFILVQPDLGTALALGGAGFCMILFMGIRTRVLVCMAVFVAVSSIPAWGYLEPYQQRRVMAMFNPYSDPAGSGYHIIQSKIAVGSGSVLGEGYMKGTQAQLHFLPEHTTDFIFSVLAEEWGFVGCFLVLGLYLLLIFRMLRIAGRSKDLFLTLLVFGLASSLSLHVVVNVGMVLGMLPVVGLPLPLFSYGGSSVVTTLFGMGLVLGVGMRRLLFLKGKQ